jgi:hypothetical protein
MMHGKPGAISTATLFAMLATMNGAWAQAAPGDKPDPIAFDNDYFHVTRDQAPCADASTKGCEDRVVVAMGKITVGLGKAQRKLGKGQVAVFKKGQSYSVSGGPFFEVAIKPDHPPVKSPPEIVPPAKNAILYESDRFFVYHEQLAPGDTRPRHSHSQRLEIRLNIGPLLDQWFDPPAKPLLPSTVNFRQPSIHTTKNIGDMALKNLIVEFKPEPK